MTTEALLDWPRRYYAPSGHNAFLFYVVYGRVDAAIPLSRGKYRSDGIPDGIEAHTYDIDTHADVVTAFRSGYLWEKFSADQPELAAKVSEQDSCLILKGEVVDPPTLNYFRDVIGFLTYCIDAGGVAIYDPQMFKWWAPTDWRAQVFDTAKCAPRHHVTVLVSEDQGSAEWIHTRGLRKFGRPDLSIHSVGSQHKDAIVDLCNRFIEMLAFGAIVPDGQEVRMPSLPPGMKCLRQGTTENPDFNNEHIEVIWPSR
jgi:hypothetical protein